MSSEEISYPAEVLPDSPHGYWRLGESGGTETGDSSGNSQNGSYKNAPTLGVAGALKGDPNTAITLNGTNQWVSIPDSPVMDLGDVLTYECWFKRGAEGIGMTLMDKGPNALIVRFLTSNKILVRRNSVANLCESTVAVTDILKWHHLAVTKNGPAVKIWLDGVDVTGPVSNSTLINTSVVLSIGASEAGLEEYFNGSLDEVAVYGTALSEARVKAHYQAGLNSPRMRPRLKVGLSYPPDKLGLRVTSPVGKRLLRLAEDEHNPNNVLSNLHTATEMSGGYKELTNVLNRLPQRVWPDLETNSDVECYLASGKNIFEGYIDKAPNVSGPQASITPNVLGYQSMLDDNENIIIGWITKDLSKWKGPSAERRKELINANAPLQGEPEVSFGPSGAKLVLSLSDAWTNSMIPRVEAWFDAGPSIKLGRLLGMYTSVNAGGSGSGWVLEFEFTNRDSPPEAPPGNVFGGAGPVKIETEVASNKRFIRIPWHYNATPAGTTSMSYQVELYNLIVLSSLGANLTLQGTSPAQGFKAQQLLVDLFAQKATNGLEARLEDIDDDGFIIQEAWYDTRGTMSSVIKELIKFGWYDWFFYNGKRFSYKRPRSYGRVWKTTVAACHLNEVGQQSTRAYDKCVVQWTDVSGEIRSVGPGGSGCTYESSACETTLPARTRTKLLTFGGALSQLTGEEIAHRFLEECVLEETSGSATLSGYVLDEHGYPHPVSEVRAGDHLEPTDAHDKEPRKIVNTDYTHQQRQNQLDLAAPASGMNALFERLLEAAAAAGV